MTNPPFCIPVIPGLTAPWPPAGNPDKPIKPPVSDRKGWQCPVCNKGISPDVKVCPCDSDTTNEVRKCPVCGGFYKGVHICVTNTSKGIIGTPLPTQTTLF